MLDLADPWNPALIATVAVPGYAYGIHLASGYAYVADAFQGGLRVFDISDPLHPEPAGAYETPGLATGVWVRGPIAYVADTYSLMVLIHGAAAVMEPTGGSAGVLGPARCGWASLRRSLPEQADDLRLDLFDCLGRRVTARRAAAGHYYCRITAGGETVTRRLTLLR